MLITPEIIREAEEIVENHRLQDLDCVGAGLYKKVYLLPSGSAVVKVPNDTGILRNDPEMLERSFEFEWALYISASSRENYPETVWCEAEEIGLYMVQEICTPSYKLNNSNWENYGDEKRLLEWSENEGITDVHSGNFGQTETGRWVVMDWGFDHPTKGTKAFEILEKVKEGDYIIS